MKNKFDLMYYINMLNRNKKTFKKEIVAIDSILEIRLHDETWGKIVRIANIKHKSFSWVVRYAVFRLIKRKDHVKYIQGWESEDRHEKFRNLSELARVKRVPTTGSHGSMHRHKLCLYGEDELLIRLCAARLSCTMSHLVRLALEWNLDNLGKSICNKLGRFHHLSFFWLGIKLFRDVEIHNHGLSYKLVRLIHYEQTDYW